MKGTVLVSTHRLDVAGRLRDAFEEEGCRVDLTPDPEQVDVAEEPVLLVVTGEVGRGDLEEWAAAARRLEIPVFTVLPEGGSPARSRRAGADEAFGPDPDPEEVALLGVRTIERRRLQAVTGIVGRTDAIREALERVVQIAPVDSTVLVTGESGTGKELVARGIHALSSRRHRPFLAVNVAAVSETLLESELFGHEKGAFTGAIDSRKGFFELADRGTLFLDEIGEMPQATQTKLLRVLEQREFLRVGGERPIRVDVRIITATNQNLRDLVARWKFRRDLYYRLNILSIELPPLRQRKEDIPLLVHHFIREVGERMDRPFPGISNEAMGLLMRYDWPGNVRELRNLVESMVVLAPGKEIQPQDIPREIRFPEEAGRLLPAPVSGPAAPPEPEARAEGVGDGEARRIRPELEFVFRTLVELRVDMDQLRQEFEIYREEVDERLEDAESGPFVLTPGGEAVGIRSGRGSGTEEGHRGETDARRPDPGREPAAEKSEGREGSQPEAGDGPDPEAEESGREIVFEAGMTMEEMEREAIQAVLETVGGNRRKAAESLGIGERTLYRKIRKYGIEA